ncbi:protein phtf [Nilaparvata lugens]|uniref:protein phtf n=1 Tax=Nilaparvata lugens TaxID=108931 RepID=UPI00193DCC3E|nr:protein phtf [Nilaparvata lugens]
MGDCTQDILSWYQKKIGTYDKQQWERTVEQRILSGFTHVPKKTAKLKPELIDVDLVRGSAFTKAKPKHGLVKVTRLAICRLVFLPLYSRWWAQQTSPKIFGFLLVLYFLQLFNTGLYLYITSGHDEDTIEMITVAEVLVPAAMMLVLCVIHSQIVSPYSSVSSGSSPGKTRRIRRTKRRHPTLSRSRNLVGSDSKSSPDTCSEVNIRSESVVKLSKRVRLRKSSKEDITQTAHDRHQGAALAIVKPLGSEELQPGKSILREVAIQEEVHEVIAVDDDGFESLNGGTTSSDNNEEMKMKNADEMSNDELNEPIENVDRLSGPDVDVDVDGDSRCDHKCMCLKNNDSVASTFSCSISGHYNVEINTNNVINDKYIHINCISDENCSPTQANENGLQQRYTAAALEPLEDKFRNEWVINQADSRLSGQISYKLLYRVKYLYGRLVNRRRGSQATLQVNVGVAVAGTVSSLHSSGDDEEESEEGEGGGGTGGSSCFCSPLLTEGGTTSAAEWIGITTNSEECSYSSDIDDLSLAATDSPDHPFPWEFQMSPSVILSPSCAASDKVSCTMWEKRDVKKADLSVLDISSAIIARVEAMPEQMEFFYAGMLVSVLLAAIPSLHRLITDPSSTLPSTADVLDSVTPLPFSTFQFTPTILSASLGSIVDAAFGSTLWERVVVLIAMFESCVLSGMFFFLLAVAERTFKQRFLYAKFFSHLTSFRRARKSELPHFRLNKVRNIKTWLSVRSYLKKRGPQRSVDMVVSAVFLITLLLLSFVSVEFLKDSIRLHVEYNVEALAWCIVLGFFLLRFMTLGDKINRKYRNLSVLITEQINLYLQIEQKPNKKDELMVANSVLKLAADLLKELESPFKISGLSANPYLYTITKVVILSALSGVLSEILGFKLKLHKIKIK